MTESLMTHSLEIWRWIIAADEPTRMSEDRRNQVLLLTLMVALIPYGVIISTLQILLTPEQSPLTPGTLFWKDGDMVAMASGLLLWLGALWLIYKGYHKQAAFLSVVTAVAVIWLGTITDGDAQDLPELVIPLLIAAMLFSLRSTVLLESATLLMLFSLPIVSPAIQAQDLVTRPFSFCYICMILIYVAFRHRQQQERERRRKLSETESALRQIQKYESLGALAGGVAHDFKNLLAGVMGQAEMAMLPLQADHPSMQWLDMVLKTTTQAADLANQLLVFSGREVSHKAPLILNQLIEASNSLFAVLPPRHLWLSLELMPNLPPVFANDTQMRQILMNLVINAVEAIDKDRGHVTIRTQAMIIDSDFKQHSFQGKVPIAFGDYVALTVSDDGTGIDEQTLLHIFEPFFTQKEKGNGLGLSTVLGIVRAHDGAIGVESTPGAGTKFTILLPTAQQSD